MPLRSPKLPRHTPPTKKVYIGEAAVVRDELNATLTKLRNDLEEKATIVPLELTSNFLSQGIPYFFVLYTKISFPFSPT